MIFMTIMVSVIAVTLYLAAAFRIGFYVFDKTEDTGFNLGFYMITMVIFVTLPIAIFIQFLSK